MLNKIDLKVILGFEGDKNEKFRSNSGRSLKMNLNTGYITHNQGHKNYLEKNNISYEEYINFIEITQDNIKYKVNLVRGTNGLVLADYNTMKLI